MNPTPTAPVNDAPVADFIRAQRQNFAYVFLGLSVLCLIGTIFLAVRAFKPAPTAEEKTEEVKPPDEGKPPELPKAGAANPKRASYMVGWIGGLAAFMIMAGVGVYLQVIPPKETIDAQRREMRLVVLAAGGLLGAALVLFGGCYFYLWSDSLTKWLDKKQLSEAKWVLAPLLSVTVGAGLVFLSAMPARAEERNDARIRRLVYGASGGVTVLLMFVALLILNIIVSMKVTNRLDTTETGFYTLSNQSREFLEKLGEPATFYVIMPESGDRGTNDIRQFVYTAQDAAQGKVKVKFVSPVTNKQELARLREKYPRIVADEGILITVGEDEKRNTYVASDELFEMEGRRIKGFAGEGKLVKELRYLADNEQKPVVYFTQSNGELAITSNPGIESIGGSAMQLKSFLEKNYIEVKPLVFPIKNPTVPDDATIVIVAEPQSPLSPEAADALRRFMNNPAKKGKLIVLAGATPGPDGKGVGKTGLEGLLTEFNVKLGDKFIYTMPTERSPDYRAIVVGFGRAAANNPIGQALGLNMRFRMPLPREAAPLQGNPAFKAEVLMLTLNGQISWLEDDQIVNFQATIRDLENEQVQVRKQVSDGPRAISVVVSESGAPNPHGGPPSSGSARMFVFGNGLIFSDKVVDKSGSAPFTFDMMGAAIDWLRDRPVLSTNVESKKYKEYQAPDPVGVSEVRLLLLPLGAAMLLIVGLGTGVWVMRRK